METASEIAKAIREKVTYSKAAEEFRKEKKYHSDRPLEDSAVEMLYHHGIYLLGRLTFLLGQRRGNQQYLVTLGIYSLYRELGDFGLENEARMIETRVNSPK